jgi:hypothetical protein
MAAALSLCIYTEKSIEAKADILAVDILRNAKVQDPVQVARDTLEKMRRQNLYRRENSIVAKVYITEDGNNVLDFVNPYLTTRMDLLNECERSS